VSDRGAALAVAVGWGLVSGQQQQQQTRNAHSKQHRSGATAHTPKHLTPLNTSSPQPQTTSQTTSCIIDRQPRQFDAESCALLANIAEMVVREIERDKVQELQVRRWWCGAGGAGLELVVPWHCRGEAEAGPWLPHAVHRKVSTYVPPCVQTNPHANARACMHTAPQPGSNRAPQPP